MFACHVGVDVLCGHSGFARNQVAQARCVQHGARAEDLVAWNTHDFQRRIGHDVNGVRDEHEAGVRCDVLQVRHDGFHEVDGGAGQLKAGLSRFLLRAGGDNHQVGSSHDFHIVGSFNGAAWGELDAVSDIERFSLDLFLVDVLEDDGAGVAPHGARIGDCGANRSSPDHRDSRRVSFRP